MNTKRILLYPAAFYFCLSKVRGSNSLFAFDFCMPYISTYYKSGRRVSYLLSLHKLLSLNKSYVCFNFFVDPLWTLIPKQSRKSMPIFLLWYGTLIVVRCHKISTLIHKLCYQEFKPSNSCQAYLRGKYHMS